MRGFRLAQKIILNLTLISSLNKNLKLITATRFADLIALGPHWPLVPFASGLAALGEASFWFDGSFCFYQICVPGVAVAVAVSFAGKDSFIVSSKAPLGITLVFTVINVLLVVMDIVNGSRLRVAG